MQLDESVTVADDAKNYNRVEENKETKQPATFGVVLCAIVSSSFTGRGLIKFLI